MLIFFLWWQVQHQPSLWKCHTFEGNHETIPCKGETSLPLGSPATQKPWALFQILRSEGFLHFIIHSLCFLPILRFWSLVSFYFLVKISPHFVFFFFWPPAGWHVWSCLIHPKPSDFCQINPLPVFVCQPNWHFRNYNNGWFKFKLCHWLTCAFIHIIVFSSFGYYSLF